MKNVIKMSKAWVAAFTFGVLLTGCDVETESADVGKAPGTSVGTESADVGKAPGINIGTEDVDVDKAPETGVVVPGIEDPAGESTRPEAKRTAVLSWSAPLTRANDESMKPAELSEYIISYGQDAEYLDREVIVPGEGVMDMAHKISDLSAGTWYFSISVKDIEGLESDPSAMVQKTFKS